MTVPGSMFHPDLPELRRDWGWFLALGILLIIVGLIAIGSAFIATFVSVVFLGWLLIIGGVMQLFSAFKMRARQHLFLQLLFGILALVVGILLIANPMSGALTVTLVLAIYFIVSGAFRIGATLGVRYPHWGWYLFSGIVTFVLGVILWWRLPVVGLWFLGFAVGLDMIFHGWSWVALSLIARRSAATA